MSPTLRNIFEPFEAWERRHRWRRQLDRMENRKLLKREERAGQLAWRLTSLGRLIVMGGTNLPARWSRPWDGRWRMLFFDLPVGCQEVRVRLLRWLRRNGFGYLQDSVWIHTDPVDEVVELLKDYRDDVESFTLMEARCCRGFSDKEIVTGAWDFDEINKRYETYLNLWTPTPREARKEASSPTSLVRWIRRERAAWRLTVASDPLLPRQLWPPGYRGEEAWQARLRMLRVVSQHLREEK
jgi:phenylacetic acid degradation operon negative regulatory protein